MALAVLRYTFQFDPAEAWTNLSQFEAYLTKSLDAIGLESSLASPLGVPSNERWIIITKKPEIPPPAPPTVSLKGNLKNLRNPNVYKSQGSYK